MTPTIDTSNISPRSEESVPVVLARMEGKLDNIKDKVDGLNGRMDKLENRVTLQENFTLILSQDAKAEEAKKIALALALKEADETRRNQSEQTWTPIQRFFAFATGLGGIITLVIYYSSTVGH